jgi:hypothetical protein
VAADGEAEKKKGPKGGIKHTPGRGHVRKSGVQKRKRFQRKAARKRQRKEQELRRQWEEWDSLPPEVRKLRPESEPRQPRPANET